MLNLRSHHCLLSRSTLPAISVTVLALLAWLALPAAAAGPTTIRVSVSSSGQQGNGGSFDLSLTDDARFVAFDSLASSLVRGDTNDAFDVFLKNLSTGSTKLISRSSGGAQGDSDSAEPAISGDGRFVAFDSTADNLVPGDTNGTSDVFVRDLVAGSTTRVSLSSSGGQGDDDSFAPGISDDGRFVTFSSAADNLVPGDTNETFDVFVRDLVAGTTTRINVASDGTQADDFSFAQGIGGGDISNDGQLVVFQSDADNLVPGDVNGRTDVFLRDTAAGTTSLLSVSSTGGEGDGDSFGAVISGNGSTVAFSSNATNLALAADMNGHKDDVFVRDLAAGTTRVVSETDEQKLGTHDSSNSKGLSDDGRLLAYRSFANNLVKGDTNHASDVFLTDLVNGGTIRVSVSSTGGQGNGDSANAVISGNGRFVGFQSFATNLVPGDTNGTSDVYVRGPIP